MLIIKKVFLYFFAITFPSFFLADLWAQVLPSCSRSEYIVNGEAQNISNIPSQQDTTCTIENCSLEGAVYEAVYAANLCPGTGIIRTIVLEANKDYEFRRAGSGPFYLDKGTALATLDKGTFHIKGNGATLTNIRRESQSIRFFSSTRKSQINIENLTMRGGRSRALNPPSSPEFVPTDGHGDAIINRGYLILNNVDFDENEVIYSLDDNFGRLPLGVTESSALFNHGGTLWISNSRFRMSSITSDGGLNITGSEFLGSSVFVGVNSRGSSIGPASISNSRFTKALPSISFHNSSQIRVRSSIDLSNVLFEENNRAERNQGTGIKILRSPPPGSVLNDYPDGLLNRPSSVDRDIVVNIKNSSFIDNHYSSGAISGIEPREGESGSLSVNIYNSTFANNRTQTGGVINCRQRAHRYVLNGVTIANNDGGYNGSGITARKNCAGMTVVNSIIANPTDSWQKNCYFEKHVEIRISSSMAVHKSCRTRLISDPMLGPLALNGGNTPNMLPLNGSPLIDAGSTYRPAYYENRNCYDPDYQVQAEMAGQPCRLIFDKDQRGSRRGVGQRIDVGSVEVGRFDRFKRLR